MRTLPPTTIWAFPPRGPNSKVTETPDPPAFVVAVAPFFVDFDSVCR